MEYYNMQDNIFFNKPETHLMLEPQGAIDEQIEQLDVRAKDLMSRQDSWKKMSEKNYNYAEQSHNEALSRATLHY